MSFSSRMTRSWRSSGSMAKPRKARSTKSGMRLGSQEVYSIGNVMLCQREQERRSILAERYLLIKYLTVRNSSSYVSSITLSCIEHKLKPKGCEQPREILFIVQRVFPML